MCGVAYFTIQPACLPFQTMSKMVLRVLSGRDKKIEYWTDWEWSEASSQSKYGSG